ncbi:carbon-nitrogen hydrolase family protein [Pseudomonas sp. SLFW]|uniref:carbon-nitrogen hydrolase family protein n=1 Tax=Pseudomonas sp. SLFW TaxID=2683259 RepID=UPI0014126FEE|nr:carbon-nitrogen hydrolase family protein [Pseudomonas sp. SLFW]NBB09775.1 carbon-nitrogen hydrolase [Pseudomonas sp. SLFW]
MNIFLAQMPIADAQVEINLSNMLSMVRNAPLDTDLLVFPETTLSGFPTADEIHRIGLAADSKPIRLIQEAARKSDKAVAFGFCELADERAYNTAMLIDRAGRIALKYRKTHLWPDTDWGVFEAGSQYAVCEIASLRVGMLICYDIEFPETARSLAVLDVDLILVLDGNMNPYGPVHRRAVIARAMENQCFAVLVNRIGEGKGLSFPGESVAVDPLGTVLVEAIDGHPVRVMLRRECIEECRSAYRYLRDRRAAPLSSEQVISEGGIPNTISVIPA